MDWWQAVFVSHIALQDSFPRIMDIINSLIVSNMVSYPRQNKPGIYCGYVIMFGGIKVEQEHLCCLLQRSRGTCITWNLSWCIDGLSWLFNTFQVSQR